MCWNLSWASPAANTSPIKSTFSTTTLPERSLCLSTSMNESAPFSLPGSLSLLAQRDSQLTGSFSAWLSLCLSQPSFQPWLCRIWGSQLLLTQTQISVFLLPVKLLQLLHYFVDLLYFRSLLMSSSTLEFISFDVTVRSVQKCGLHQTQDSTCKNFSWWHTQTCLELPPWTLAQLLLPSVFSQQPGWLGWAHKN